MFFSEKSDELEHKNIYNQFLSDIKQKRTQFKIDNNNPSKANAKKFIKKNCVTEIEKLMKSHKFFETFYIDYKRGIFAKLNFFIFKNKITDFLVVYFLDN